MVRHRWLCWYQSESFTQNLSQYLVKNITKQELAEQFFSEQNVTDREEFLTNSNDIEDLMEQYKDLVYHIGSLLEYGYGKLSAFDPVIIINASSVQRLELMRKAATIDDLIEAVRRGSPAYISGKIPQVIQEGPIRVVNTKVDHPLLNMKRQLKTVETNLREYQDSIKMDSQFYL